ncbi:hypothetical protein D6817_02635 [Candidatus Pacearchaeota archaeon]|nr:MAG: hypothetical protein D6817_02635 [Candidatus Pacearchaeota archaeon]
MGRGVPRILWQTYNALRECNALLGYDEKQFPRFNDPISEKDFRKGVSRGEMRYCLEEELAVLRLACKELRFNAQRYNEEVRKMRAAIKRAEEFYGINFRSLIETDDD